jgi:hypothetical protein
VGLMHDGRARGKAPLPQHLLREPSVGKGM